MDVKLKLTDKDYYQTQEGFTTILNSDFACLTRVEEIVAKLKPGEVFIDDEFGPNNPKDKVKGHKLSLYDN